MPRLFPALSGLALLMLAGSAAAQLAPPPELYGAYAPGGDCTKEPKVTLQATAITILSAGKATRLSPIDACFSCEGGARYEGIVVWVSQLGADRNPIEPFFYFNAGEKKGALAMEKQGAQKYPPAQRAVALASPLVRCKK
jgi:hypothetical protein